MQDTDAAIRELEQAKDAGHLGVQIGSNINGLNLSRNASSRSLKPCQRLG